MIQDLVSLECDIIMNTCLGKLNLCNDLFYFSGLCTYRSVKKPARYRDSSGEEMEDDKENDVHKPPPLKRGNNYECVNACYERSTCKTVLKTKLRFGPEN